MALPSDANVGAYLSVEIYIDLPEPLPGQSVILPSNSNFLIHQVNNDTASGYYGAVIEDTTTGEVFLVSRGTEFGTSEDRTADYYIAKGDIPEAQFNAAQDLLTSYNSANPSNPVTSSTGHSLGGYLAQLVGITQNLDVITIGSPGAQSALDNLEDIGFESAAATTTFLEKTVTDIGDTFQDAFFGSASANTSVYLTTPTHYKMAA